MDLKYLIGVFIFLLLAGALSASSEYWDRDRTAELLSPSFEDDGLNVSGDITANQVYISNLNVTNTTTNATFQGDAKIEGILYGGSPLRIGEDLEVQGEINMSGVAGDGEGRMVCILANGQIGTCSAKANPQGICPCV
jgi:hypothetical protein